MERRHNTSLDRVLCDPQLAAEFDESAQRVAPGVNSLQYRWAALNLRKSRQLQPELISRVIIPPMTHTWSMKEFRLNDVPLDSGLYLIYDSKQVLYVGESENLRSRLKKHLDHSDNKGFARWLWESGPQGLNIEVHVLPNGTTTRVRKALELELIRSRKPVFNMQR
jgi:site-specific DNA-methyltransferase (adenine-specific)